MSRKRPNITSALVVPALLMTFWTNSRAEPIEPGPATKRISTPVTLLDDGDRWTLNNGVVRNTVLKRNAELSSIVYRGIEILTRGRYWEQPPSAVVGKRLRQDNESEALLRATLTTRR